MKHWPYSGPSQLLLDLHQVDLYLTAWLASVPKVTCPVPVSIITGATLARWFNGTFMACILLLLIGCLSYEKT